MGGVEGAARKSNPKDLKMDKITESDMVVVREKTISRFLDKNVEIRKHANDSTVWIKYHPDILLIRILKSFLRLFGFCKGKWYHVGATPGELYVDGEKIEKE